MNAPMRTSDRFQDKPDPAELARDQGFRTPNSLDALLGDFWPDDESVDAFMTARKAWQRELKPTAEGS
jgi:hypothetical protein